MLQVLPLTIVSAIKLEGATLLQFIQHSVSGSVGTVRVL